jgi:hypothetical protein
VKVGSLVKEGELMHEGDRYVLIFLIVLLVIVLFLWLRRWINTPTKPKWVLKADDEVLVTDAVILLEEAGYEVMTQKRKVPISMLLNEQEELQSRLFIDHFAKRDNEWYVVILARPRKLMELTGSSIRDHLLPYHLLYKEADGILYVDTNLHKIIKVQFTIEL